MDIWLGLSYDCLSMAASFARDWAQASDQELIRGCREGDNEAWQQVIDRYQRLVQLIPFRYGVTDAEAADIAQRTFIILLESLDQLKEEGSLGGWLATVSRRQTWRYLAGSKREWANLSMDDELVAESAAALGLEATDRISQWEVSAWLQHGLDQVNEKCRELLYLLYFDNTEPSYTDIGQKLRIPVGSIGPTRARCLESLLRFLGKD